MDKYKPTASKKAEIIIMNIARGMKTGTTDSAGKCLVSVAKKGDNQCLSVVLGESTDEGRFGDSKGLLEAGVQ